MLGERTTEELKIRLGASTVVAATVNDQEGLWIGFSIDYTTTRDIYFAFAIAHVMAEFPFLVKML